MIRRWLELRYLPWYLAVLAMVLCSPALKMGWYLDDHFHRAALTRPDVPGCARTPAELFAFIKGDEESTVLEKREDGAFKTFETDPQVFSFAASSCASNLSEADVLETIANTSENDMVV